MTHENPIETNVKEVLQVTTIEVFTDKELRYQTVDNVEEMGFSLPQPPPPPCLLPS